jgi:hypothetical protein
VVGQKRCASLFASSLAPICRVVTSLAKLRFSKLTHFFDFLEALS